MALPYNTQGMPALMNLTSAMEMTGQRVGGTSEMQVGEGRPDAPVGTTLALIEQATKVLNSVHKRLHASQAEEFRLLCGIFQEHPNSFWERNSKPATPWDHETFLRALEDYDITPQADPNTASHGQRAMKIMGLKQLQAANPSLYDPKAIDSAALQALGWSNPQQFFAPPQTSQMPPPQVMEAMMKAQTQQTVAQARMMDAKTKQVEAQAKMQQGYFTRGHSKDGPQGGLAGGGDPMAQMQAQATLMDAQTKRAELIMRAKQADTEDQQREMDRQSKERIEAMGLFKDILAHPEEHGLASNIISPIEGLIKE